MDCRICKGSADETVYDGPIRSGGVGSEYVEGYSVQRCEDCSVEFLHPFDKDLLDLYDYEDEEYWDGHHGSVDVEQLQKQHDPEQLRWLSEIGVNRFRGSRVADFGCAAGQFLDLLAGVASETIGVDPAEHFQPHLKSNDHAHEKYPADLPAETVDVGVSFDTVEHIESPREFLADVKASLKPGGDFFVGVPNRADFLTSIVPAYRPFFYHKSHLFYYNETALTRLLKSVGFEMVSIEYVHKYDLMNMIVWARDGEPGGHERESIFDDATEAAFRRNIEREGIASHLLIRASA